LDTGASASWIVHELSICENILATTLDAAKKASAKKIVRVRVKHGELRAIVPEIMQHYFEFLAKDTLASGAKLEMQAIKASAKCKSCGDEYGISEFNFKCPKCGKDEPELLTGMELLLEDIEIEE